MKRKGAAQRLEQEGIPGAFAAQGCARPPPLRPVQPWYGGAMRAGRYPRASDGFAGPLLCTNLQ